MSYAKERKPCHAPIDSNPQYLSYNTTQWEINTSEKGDSVHINDFNRYDCMLD